MRKLLLFLPVIILLSSCIKERYYEDNSRKNNTQAELSGEQKSVKIFNDFLTNLNKSEPTKAISVPQVVSVNKTSAMKYNGELSRIGTRAPENDMPVYELTLQNEDRTRGFAVVTADSLFSEVVAYSEKGSISDTTFNGGMAIYFRSLSEYLTALKESYSDTPSTKTYWQPYGGSPFTMPETETVVTTYPTYQAFINAGGLYYSYGAWDETDMRTATVPVNWDQGAPYNDKVPDRLYSDPSQRVRVGCFAVALGQLMSYHKKPVQYDWATISTYATLTVSSPATAKDKISTLLYDIALYGKTTFKPDKNVGTTDAYNTAPTLDYFGYYFTQTQNGTISSEVIRNNIIINRPCLMAATTTLDQGHIWVIDGVYREYRWYYWTSHTSSGGPDPHTAFIRAALYKVRQRKSMLHMNWGWGGASNGWYFSFSPFVPSLNQTVDLTTNFFLWTDIRPK